MIKRQFPDITWRNNLTCSHFAKFNPSTLLSTHDDSKLCRVLRAHAVLATRLCAPLALTRVFNRAIQRLVSLKAHGIPALCNTA